MIEFQDIWSKRTYNYSIEVNVVWLDFLFFKHKIFAL